LCQAQAFPVPIIRQVQELNPISAGSFLWHIRKTIFH